MIFATLKKIIAIAAALCAVMMLTGCGASLSVYDYTGADGLRYNVYELTIERAVVEKMEETATQGEDGKKYTVPDYFYALFTGYGYELTEARYTEEKYTAKYRRAFSSTPDLYNVGKAPEFEHTYTENPFMRDYTATAENPFNGVRQAFDEVMPDQSGTIIQQLKNGKVAINEFGDRVVIFPSVTDAFPYVAELDPDGLLLNYVFVGAKRMNSSGVTAGQTEGSVNYVFSRYFDRTDETITLEYRRPVAYGWYLVALVVGGLTLAVIILATRPKKQKPTLLERFPYNPEQYRDYESHLPMNR